MWPSSSLIAHQPEKLVFAELANFRSRTPPNWPGATMIKKDSQNRRHINTSAYLGISVVSDARPGENVHGPVDDISKIGGSRLPIGLIPRESWIFFPKASRLDPRQGQGKPAYESFETS